MSVAITIDNVVKRFGKDTIINGLSVDVRPGEFFTLLGPSGCGKTTLLRMIIGFNSIEGGTIKIDDQIINDIPTHLRNMGMVFQNYAIFPHMSVKDNVAFGLKNRKVAKEKMNANTGNSKDCPSERPDADAAFRWSAAEGCSGSSYCYSPAGIADGRTAVQS